MQKGLFSYIWLHTKQQQIWIIAVILASLPFYFLSFDLPRLIINGPIQGRGFAEPGATARLLELKITNPWIVKAPLTLFSGFELDRVQYLVALSGLFLLLVLINGLFKLSINTYKGRLGERMLRRLRYELIDRVMRFPFARFRTVRSAEIATMVKDEVEPLGGFIGDAFVLPMLLASQAATTVLFIFMQNVWLALIAVGMVLIQAVLVPRMRRRLLVLGRERQLLARELAGQVGEIVDGITEVRLNDASQYERSRVADLLGRIFFVRYEIFQRKFSVKFINNLLVQIVPFLFFLFGGYFAIRGRLDVGQLVAVIVAYKDLPSPIKELIDWDQERQDLEIKFAQVAEQFAPDDLTPDGYQGPDAGPVPSLAGPITFADVVLEDERGKTVLAIPELTLLSGSHVAIVGAANSGGERIGELLARLVSPAHGRITLGTQSLAAAKELVTGRRIAYVGPDVFLRNQSLQDCLTYGLVHFPRAPAAADAPRRSPVEHLETVKAGNSTLDPNADWIDYAAAGVGDAAALQQRLHRVVEMTDLESDILELGLASRVAALAKADAGRLIEARRALRQRLDTLGIANLVENFDASRYNEQANVGENLLFAAVGGSAQSMQDLAHDPQVSRLLAANELHGALCDIGARIVRVLGELLSQVEPGQPFYEQAAFQRLAKLPIADIVSTGTSGEGQAKQEPTESQLIALALCYAESEHRLGVLDGAARDRIVSARGAIRRAIPAHVADRIAFYESDGLIAGANIEDNVLFGRVVRGIADGQRRVRIEIRAALDRLGLLSAVLSAGLCAPVGPGGKMLAIAQRQKVALVRAVIKGSDVIVVNRGLSALGLRSQRAIIERILEYNRSKASPQRSSIIWALQDPRLTELFDRVLVFDDGRIVEDGEPGHLLASKGRLHSLLS